MFENDLLFNFHRGLFNSYVYKWINALHNHPHRTNQTDNIQHKWKMSNTKRQM